MTASFLLPLCAHAANVDWDGAGSANASGTWETGANWTGDAKPTASDNARLLDVTSGTREVTISNGLPQIINQLTITQTTAGAVNVLNVNDNLTISGSANPFAVTATAGQDSIVTNIAAGKTLLATHAGSMTVSFGGELNLVAGSVFKLQATGGSSNLTSPTLNGAINATGAGARLVFQPGGSVGGTGALFGGAVTVSGSGSSLEITRLTSTDVVNDMVSTYSGNDGAGNAVNVGDGATLTINVIKSATTFTNRVTLGNSSTLNIGNVVGGGTSTNNFSGGLVIGANSNYTLVDSSVAINLNGTSSVGSGSQVTLKYVSAQGNSSFVNNGALTMDGAALIFDYAAPGFNNGVRGLTNTGNWILKNNASFSLISSTGVVTIGNGFGNLRNLSNTGTFSLESGSTFAFDSFLNTGTLNLGSSTLGVSDSQVVFGSPANTFNTTVVNNGYTTGQSTLNILGNTLIGRPTAAGTSYLDNGTARNGLDTATSVSASIGNTINIGNGSTAMTLAVGNVSAAVTNAAGNTINLNSNAKLLIQSRNTDSSNGSTTLVNSGIINHAGNIQFQSNFFGTRSFTNSATSTYRITGTGASIQALAGTGSASTVFALTFTSSGLITGASAHDKLTYVNSTGYSPYNKTTLTITDGEITPGNGTSGSGVSSIGQLEFSNLNIALAGATKLSFDIGGLGNDAVEFGDPFLFDYILTDSTFSIGSSAVLDIRMANNGFVTPSSQSYLLVDSTNGGNNSFTGTFSSLLFEGVAVTDQYTVAYTSSGLLVTLAAGLGNSAPIPEPSSVVMLAGLGVIAFAGLRRRQRV